MTEQTTPPTTIQKTERSANYVVSRLSYDTLISSTKMFVHNYNVLTEEEKSEFKSLATYVKQLEKCLPPKNKSLPKKKPVVPTIATELTAAAATTDVPVEEKVVEPVKASKRGGKKAEPKEVSPTETAAAAIVDASVASASASVSVPIVEVKEAKEDKKTVKKNTNTKLK